METVTLEEALEMFKLPRLVGQTEDGKDIKANIGRFGPYVQVDKQYFSIKPHDPMTIELDEARNIIAEITEKRKPIAEFHDGRVQILNGPYGPYIKDNETNTNARIPKTLDPKTISEDEAMIMLAEAPKKKFTKRRQSTKKKK